MVESQTYVAFCHLMDTQRETTVGNHAHSMSVLDLFDHYTEFDERRKATSSSRFVSPTRIVVPADTWNKVNKRVTVRALQGNYKGDTSSIITVAAVESLDSNYRQGVFAVKTATVRDIAAHPGMH